MVQLVDSDIKTREVLGWKGVHVLHFAGSSCSQKLRIFLNLKGIPWESHPIDLPGNENFRPWFLGINPRGLVPVLVHDGVVHIESNDIIQYLEKTFPAPKLIPAGQENEVAALLKHEDDLHLVLRPRKTKRLGERAGGLLRLLGRLPFAVYRRVAAREENAVCPDVPHLEEMAAEIRLVQQARAAAGPRPVVHDAVERYRLALWPARVKKVNAHRAYGEPRVERVGRGGGRREFC